MMKKMMLMAAMACLSLLPADAGQFLLGKGKENISPRAEMLPFLSPHEKYPYVDVHDSLYARALVMSDGSKPLVLVELDETGVPDAARLQQAVAKAAKTDAGRVLLCVSHTHSTLHPQQGNQKLQKHILYLEQQTVKAVTEAAGKMVPAQVAFGRTQSFNNINNGEIVQSPAQYDENSFSDKTLDLIRFTGDDGHTLAVIVNYSTHAEVMFRSVSAPGGYEISGDLPGRVAALMENAIDGHPLILTTTGAEGDQQPLYTSLQRTATMGVVDQGAGGWSVVDVLAHRIADDALSALQKMPQGESPRSLAAVSAQTTVPGRNSTTVSIPLSLFTLGSVRLLGVGADLAAKIGASVRSAAQANTMLITNTAGSIGYVLEDKAYEHSTHGVKASRVLPGHVEEALIQQLKQLRK
jgi:hypothetical protein